MRMTFDGKQYTNFVSFKSYNSSWVCALTVDSRCKLLYIGGDTRVTAVTYNGKDIKTVFSFPVIAMTFSQETDLHLLYYVRGHRLYRVNLDTRKKILARSLNRPRQMVVHNRSLYPSRGSKGYVDVWRNNNFKQLPRDRHRIHAPSGLLFAII